MRKAMLAVDYFVNAALGNPFTCLKKRPFPPHSARGFYQTKVTVWPPCQLTPWSL